MRLARFRTTTATAGFGVVDDHEVVHLDHRVDTFQSLLADPVPPHPDDPRQPLAEVILEPPMGDDPKVVCVGFNYAAHAVESPRGPSEPPSHPTLFARFGDTLVGAGTPVVRPDGEDSLDWEGEVALVIGRPGRRLAPDDAWAHVAGVTCMAENSVRTWQQHSSQATAGKNWYRSGSLGPWLSTLDEVGRGPLRVTTRLNGEVVQDDTTDRLTFSFADLVAYVSAFTPLRPGDVIATGTPAGIGLRREPPRFLRPGDELEVEVSGVGVLRNGVVDETAVDETAVDDTAGAPGLAEVAP